MADEPMPDHDGKRNHKVNLGFGGSWGFAGPDLTSPARAAHAGALPDALPARFDVGGSARELPITELRVHGVSGSNGPTMLEHPTVLQVAGDSTTMFYRRWTPAGQGGAGVPWKMEAYSWGGLTEAALASAAWVLMSPFMLYNVAQFMLPPAKRHEVERFGTTHKIESLSRDKAHAVTQTLLRLMALAATVQFIVAVVSILVNTVALQAAGGHGHFPTWLSWYPHWSVWWRVFVSALLVAAIVAAMWWISVRTASRYEAQTAQANPDANERWPLTQPGFWKGQELVRRQRSLHAAAALASTAVILARPGEHMHTARTLVLVLALLVLTVVVVTLCLPLADRYNVTLKRASTRVTQATVWCRVVLGFGLLAFAASLCTRGWPDERKTAAVSLSGFTNFCAILLAIQVALLVSVGIAVTILVVGAPKTPKDSESAPFLGGHLTTLIAALALGLGGIFCAVVNLFSARFFGTPIPSGLHLQSTPAYALQIPWPIYAFAAAPIGVAAGLIVAGPYLAWTWLSNTHRFNTPIGIAGGVVRSPVSEDYGIEYGNPDDEDYRKSRVRVARAWAVGLLVDQAAVVTAFLALGMFVALGWAEIAALIASNDSAKLPSGVHGFATAESLVGLFLAGLLVTLLRTAYSNPSGRKTIGAIWDVATFWPRATHPFAPPCYAERAVPALVDRIRVLTGTVTPDSSDPAWRQIQAHERNALRTPELLIETTSVLLTGYSQGSIIAPAVVAQLPDGARNRVALLTLACPARRLYGRAFPGYFGPTQLGELRTLLDCPSNATTDTDTDIGLDTGRGRWKNLVRRSDYIGSWVCEKPDWNLSEQQLRLGIDQPCWDPVTVAADIDPTPPPIHRHSDWWPDPRVTELGRHLGEVLAAAPRLAAAEREPAGEPSS